MRKTFFIGMLIVCILFLSASCAKKPAVPKAGSAKAEDMLALIPKSAIGVLVVDINSAMKTDVAADALSEKSPNYAKYQEFVQKTGVDIKKDVFFLVAAATGDIVSGEQEGVAVINMKHNKDLLLAALKEQAPEIAETDYNGITIYAAQDPKTNKRVAGVFLDDSNIVVGSENAVKSVLDVLQKKTESVLKNDQLAPLIKTSNTSAMLWSAIAIPASAADKVSQNPFLSNLQGIKSVLLSFDYRNKRLLAEIKALGMDEAHNKQLAEMLTGFKAMAALGAEKEPEAAELLNRIAVSSTADHVAINADIPEDLLKKMGEKAKAKVAEKLKIGTDTEKN